MAKSPASGKLNEQDVKFVVSLGYRPFKKKNQKQKTDSKNPKWRKGLDVNRNILAENEIKFFSGLNVEENVG